jgi:oligopeptide transport system permease protein
MENIPQEAFMFAPPPETEQLHPAYSGGYAADALRRFRKNSSAVAAAVVLVALLLFALLGPILSPYGVSFRDGRYKNMLPKWQPLAFLGWDGCRIETVGQGVYDLYSAMDAVRAVQERQQDPATAQRRYRLRVDGYEKVGFVYLDVSEEGYGALRAYEAETGHQVCYPIPRNYRTHFPAIASGANLWYALADPTSASTGESAYHDENGDPVFVPDYLLDESGEPVYAVKNQTGFRIRVRYSAYYRYQNGVDPQFLFGTNQHGQDIFTCLASGARLSFLLSLAVSLINFAIGITYGAIAGYYGGRVDLFMERISDILAAVPFIVVATLFQLHLAAKAGPVAALLFAFVLTGWIGIAARVRTQFYRYKHAEYVLAARTLGASDRRLIFRHILPNAMGTIITGTILIIPGVIFSESMLSYLGIVNLEATGFTSIGTMLASGRNYLGTHPHIIAFPAVFIALLQIGFNLFGNGLRDALNPVAQKD